MRKRRLAAVLLAATIVAASCGGDDDGQSVSTDVTSNPSDNTDPAATDGPDATDAPDGTQASEATDAPDATDAPAERPGGDFTVAITGVRETFDPISTGATIKSYISFLFDPLIGVDDDGTPNTTSGLATGWEYNADNTQLTVTIRDGVKFHNGEDLTADDVKFSVDRVLGPDSVTSWAATWRQEVASVDVVDPTTVQFNLTRPQPLFHYRLTRLDGQEGYIVPKDYMESGADFNAEPVGSGPYKVESFQAGNSEIVYSAFDGYWRGLPAFDRIIIRNVDEAGTRVNQLRAGESDFIDVPRDLADSLESDGFNIVASPVTSHLEMWLLNQWEGIFSDERVREAMNIAIDRQTIIDTIFAGRAELPNFFPMTTLAIGYTGPADIPYDPERAKQLITEAGVEGATITMDSYGLSGIAEAPQMIEAVAGYWQAIGLNPEIVPAEFANVRKQMTERDPALDNTVGWMRNAPLKYPGPGVRILAHSEGLLTLHEDPEVDKLVEAIEAAQNDEEAAKAVQDLTAYVAEHNLRTPIAEVQQLYAANPDKVPADYNMGQYSSDVYLNGLLFND
jgi:peptide/nickel transport system substrate-binding protein